MAEQDASVTTGQSLTASAVSVARLLLHECNRLLQLYKEKETFLADHTLEPGTLVHVPPSPSEGEPTADMKVQQLHTALRQCLGLLQCVMQKEENEWGEMEDDYGTMRKTVQSRLVNLLHTTKALVETKDVPLEVTPAHQCNEEVDGAGLNLKLWIFRVLTELIHWADHAKHTLNILHRARGGPAPL